MRLHETVLREVLDRLLLLNHECYAEEVAQGLHDKGNKKGKSGFKGIQIKEGCCYFTASEDASTYYRGRAKIGSFSSP